MRSTPGQLEDFKSSSIWFDIREELSKWLNEIHEQLENQGLHLDHRGLDRLGGCAEAVRSFDQIVEVLIGLAEEDEEGRTDVLDKLIGGKRNG